MTTQAWLCGSLVISTVLCSLVGGLVFTFAIVVMPGIATLDDRAFLRAFQVMDGVIQNNQPVFMFVWLSSIPALLIAGGVSVFGSGDMVVRMLGALATALYIFGVQWPTKTINIPLNNALKHMQLDLMSDAELRTARVQFEAPWVKWNAIRTAFALITTTLLIIIALRVNGGGGGQHRAAERYTPIP
ncbi:hypothetical protein FVE85_8898 [Porphyridium purpureum]|uniref:DUF1772 domain-containing protein n=1 Tax=Porphyridium purpureum TaxID=35688 RepID=A0A5J4YRN6_PORPP|nr:hypothetical protein FVE85_8898 [Porphyridium purpureum]|eukprot:POR7284..scf296_7